jgi:ABC-type molybdate transport system substrate-binding protein
MRGMLLPLRTILAVCLLVALPASAETIRVAAAISLKESLTEVAQRYQTATGDRVELNANPTGERLSNRYGRSGYLPFLLRFRRGSTY